MSDPDDLARGLAEHAPRAIETGGGYLIVCMCGDERDYYYPDHLASVVSRILDAVPDVPPDPPAIGRDELARWFATRHRERAVEDADYAEADALLSSGVLADAADVRARFAEELADAFEARPYEQHAPAIKPASHGDWWLFDCETCGHFESGSEAHLRELKAAHESMGSPLRPEKWLRDRAVSEREGTT